MQPAPELGEAFARLAEVVAVLRGRCPWTAALTHESLLEYLVEESYEVIEAIETGATTAADAAELSGELGDVLFQVLLHARLQEEQGHFSIAEVIAALTAKMIRRNPHVFTPDGAVRDTTASDPAEIERTWDEVKKSEKPARTSPLDGIPPGLPALALAAKTLSRARRGGLELPAGPGPAGSWDTEEELGEQLLGMVRDASAQGFDAERALRGAVRRYASGHP